MPHEYPEPYAGEHFDTWWKRLNEFVREEVKGYSIQAAKMSAPPQPFNKLTPAEAERLAVLAEEAGEVVQVVMKILRHGYESSNPDRPGDGTNRDQLCVEYGHLMAAADLMVDSKDFGTSDLIARARYEKPKQRAKYLHHQETK